MLFRYTTGSTRTLRGPGPRFGLTFLMSYNREGTMETNHQQYHHSSGTPRGPRTGTRTGWANLAPSGSSLGYNVVVS